MKPMLTLLEELTNAFGPSGNEEAVRSLILSYIQDYARCEVDALGNIIAYKTGKKRPQKHLMLDAHMDEVGMIVTSILPNGMLRFAPIGGITTEALIGKRVTFGEMEGVIGCVPIHLLPADEKNKLPAYDKLLIDIGADSEQQAARWVQPGAVCTFKNEFLTFGEHRIQAKALDDRAGCAILIDMIRRKQPYDMTFTFTVREEVGLLGAKTAAFQVAPDAALVLETTTAADIAGVAAQQQVCALGKGTVISFMDHATLYDSHYYHHAFEVAARHAIPCQAKRAVAGGNNAGAIHASRGGIPTLALSLPCRYLHSAACVIDEDDLQATAELAQTLACSICAGELDSGHNGC